MTTVVVDKYGRWYDLSHNHPAWEQKKSGNELINIAVNAFTCSKEFAIKMTKKTKSLSL